MSVTNIMIVKGYHIPAMTPQLADVVTSQLGGGWIPVGEPQNTDVYGEASQLMVKSSGGESVTAYSLGKGASPAVPTPGDWDTLGLSIWVESGTWLQAFTQGTQLGGAVNLSAANVTGILPIIHGGTGAQDDIGARSNLNAAKSGVNSDITQLTQQVQVPDPVGSSDIATKRYVDNHSGGGGANLNGVMNYGVGQVQMAMFRSLIRPYELPLDGQIVDRAAYPELWAYAQAVGTVTDTVWFASPANRGRFSDGNGSTNFRLPDWNGVQTGSIKALFARGDGGAAGQDGVIKAASAPNITGSFAFHGSSSDGSGFSPLGGASGAFTPGGVTQTSTITGGTRTSVNAYPQANLSAAISSAIYGRDGNTTDLYPNHVTGVWTVRANGGFVAANTAWQVMNADAVAPTPGTIVRGGNVQSQYLTGTTLSFEADYYAEKTAGQSVSYAVMSAINGAQNAQLKLGSDGNASVPGNISAGGLSVTNNVTANQNKLVRVTTQTGGNKDIYLTNASGDGTIGGYVNQLGGNWYNDTWSIGGVRGSGSTLTSVQLNVVNAGSQSGVFQFRPDYGGHMTSNKGYKSGATAGAYGVEINYMGSPFWADVVAGNDGGYVPLVAGGTKTSVGNYQLNASFGILSGGTAGWPSPIIDMSGDGNPGNHRHFAFSVSGDIYTYGSSAFPGDYQFTKSAISDVNSKYDIVYTDGNEAAARVAQWKPVMFKYKGQTTQRYGYIAQDMQGIDPQYVQIIPGAPEFDKDGNVTGHRPDTLVLDSNMMLVELGNTVNYLMSKIEVLEQRLKDAGL